MGTVLEHISNYLNSLDWAYILTFILIAYAINHQKVKAFITRKFGITIRTRYRVLIVGIIYAILLFFIRGYELSQVETLLQSFIFAVVFHKLLIETIIEKVLPNTITGDTKQGRL